MLRLPDMKLNRTMATAALLALLPLSSLAYVHKNERPKPDRPPGHPVHKPENFHKPESHPHVPFFKHESNHGKAYGKEVKEHFQAAKAAQKH